MRTETLTSDLAYVRDLAEAGQNAPLLGGRFLMWWGGLMTPAYLGHYFISTGKIGVGPEFLWIWWLSLTLIGFVGQKVLKAVFPPKPGASSVGNRVQGVLWMSAGFMLFAFFVGVFGRAFFLKGGFDGFYWSVPLVIGLYGLCQLVTGLIAESGALKFAGFAALAGSTVACLLTGTEYVWLAGAAVVFLAGFVPGLLMMRSEPATTV